MSVDNALHPVRPADPPVGPTPWERLRPLVLRLHFYAGVLVAPFLLVAAISGTLYAATPQLEGLVHRHQLQVPAVATPLPLTAQIQAATDARGGAEPAAVRPAPDPTSTTRVLFADPTLGESERTAVFVDPGTGEIRGELTVYGTSGSLPVRTWISQLHRNLHLGEPGRLYSELAASWLGVLALSGSALWLARRRPRGSGRGPRARTRRVHGVLGIWLAVGLVGLSATGLTWSTYAGAHVDALRAGLSWTTPTVETTAPGAGPAVAGGNHDHHGPGGATGGADPAVGRTTVSPAAFATVLATARSAGLTAAKIEVKAPSEAGATWKVDEIDRGWHTRVDSAAVVLTSTDAGLTGEVTDVVRFSDYPFMAKLARWGIDLHMGSFGVLNQLVLLALGLGLTGLLAGGYRMWWLRRPDLTRRAAVGPPPRPGTWRSLPVPLLALVVAGTVALGWALPLLGASLALFLVLDLALRRRWRPSRASGRSPRGR
ncbi:PepSY-associated TM helix domain-containing protein [Kineococcus gynurae]|uniref:PepSY-associated TM helix domain-containing protein n=1 Tax=Kineococcus gynurae TaxID=452979 RepID=A0ABV5LSM9_9ACTN